MMKRLSFLLLSFATLWSVPFITSAAVATDFQSLVYFLIGLIQIIIPLLIAIAIIVFFWGIIRYIFAAGNEQVKTSARETMLWGTIALFLMVSVWGILKIIANTFGISN